MADSRRAVRIRSSGLFDPEFYRKTYGHWIAAGEDPLEHFLRDGLSQGYVPSATFDPVLYRVLTPQCGGDNPLIHSLDAGRPFAPRPLPELFPEIAVRLAPSRIPDSELNRIYDESAAAARSLPFSAAGHEFTLRIPGPGEFLDRLRADRPFAYARLPHGFWDSLWMADFAEENLVLDSQARGLAPAQRRALALRICSSIRPGNGAFAPSFMDEVLEGVSANSGHPDFLRAVSFTGYPTFDGDVVGSHPIVPRDAVLSRFAAHFRPGETLYDAMIWKRHMVTGHLGALAELCRDRHVVLVASDLFEKLGERWGVKAFTHVGIPRSLSQWQRWDLLKRTLEAVHAASAGGGRPPIVLTQCGGSLAFWLISRLFAANQRAFYIDLGQSLNGWFFDLPVLRKAAWVRLYAPAVVADPVMESYYRTLMGAGYGEWRREFLGAASNAQATGSHSGSKPDNGGREMQGNVKKDAVLDTADLVKTIKARRPGLLHGDLTEQAAAAFLLQAFQVLQEELNGAPEGRVNIKGLGTFGVRTVEREEGGARVKRKTASLRLK